MMTKEMKNGFDYSQNYDLILKWMVEVFKDQTLRVLGIETGKIIDSFTFEPHEISVKEERLDIIVRDNLGAYYHVEEQRNLTLKDMYRFAGYHFQAAYKYENLRDILIISGNVYPGKKEVVTPNASYKPIVVDLTEKNGRKRLDEIKQAVKDGDFDDLLELVFIPLYGKEDNRNDLALDVLAFELELCKKQILSKITLAATIVMTNKIVDRAKLKTIWEELKMVLEAFKFAEEEGHKKGFEQGVTQGMSQGISQGKLQEAFDSIYEILEAKFDEIPDNLHEKIAVTQDIQKLKYIRKRLIKCETMEEAIMIFE